MAERSASTPLAAPETKSPYRVSLIALIVARPGRRGIIPPIIITAMFNSGKKPQQILARTAVIILPPIFEKNDKEPILLKKAIKSCDIKAISSEKANS